MDVDVFDVFEDDGGAKAASADGGVESEKPKDEKEWGFKWAFRQHYFTQYYSISAASLVESLVQEGMMKNKNKRTIDQEQDEGKKRKKTDEKMDQDQDGEDEEDDKFSARYEFVELKSPKCWFNLCLVWLNLLPASASTLWRLLHPAHTKSRFQRTENSKNSGKRPDHRRKRTNSSWIHSRSGFNTKCVNLCYSNCLLISGGGHFVHRKQRIRFGICAHFCGKNGDCGIRDRTQSEGKAKGHLHNAN